MSTYQLGLVSISFRKYAPEEIIRAAKTAGLSCIEWGSDVHAPARDIPRLQEIVALQQKYGMACSSYGTYLNVENASAESLQAHVDAAKTLGTRILRLWCGSKRGDQMTDAERDAFFARCREVAEVAEKKDVIFCMECHHGTFTQRPEDAVALMQAVNSPHFRMYWQPFQWLDTAGSLAVARTVAPYTEHIHVFNWHGDGKFPLAEAVEDWKTYLTAFVTPRTLLLEFMPDDRIESLPAEADALRSIIGGIRS